MSFQSLRANNIVYILNKGVKPMKVETGSVVSVTAPIPKYPIPQQFGQAPEMVVDIMVRVGEHNATYQKLPANLDIADFGNNGMQIISTSRDAMNNEVMALKQKSVDVLNSLEFHQAQISECDSILQALNPEYAEKQQQQAEINGLKEQMQIMAKSMTDLASVIADLKSERHNPKPKKD